MDPRETGTLCQECGHRYRYDWNIPDYLWAKVVGWDGPKLLCGPCITRRVETWSWANDEFGALRCKEE